GRGGGELGFGGGVYRPDGQQRGAFLVAERDRDAPLLVGVRVGDHGVVEPHHGARVERDGAVSGPQRGALAGHASERRVVVEDLVAAQHVGDLVGGGWYQAQVHGRGPAVVGDLQHVVFGRVDHAAADRVGPLDQCGQVFAQFVAGRDDQGSGGALTVVAF